ncbi:MAG: RluA family pseudouridine synthase [Clostridia bacterium]|nr:RluA family pseudouridine synthase [Clostridia bacterium]
MEYKRENTALYEKYGLTVLYEDNHIIAVEKPVNMPVQKDASGDEDLCTRIRAYLKEAGNKPGEAYLGLVHRLDRPVGGAMVFAKTSKAAARLTDRFKDHSAKKRYCAIVCGTAENAARLEDWLVKDERTNTSYTARPETPGAKKAVLRFETLARADGLSLVDIALETGRPHQIRVQFSSRGLPLYGDQRYHPEAKAAAKSGANVHRAQIALWAYALTVPHPTLGEEMTFFSMPRGAVWNRFSAQVRTLPAFRVCTGLYADEDIIAVDKKAGAEVEGDLVTELGSVYGDVRAVHRLDANTEGTVVFARNDRTQQLLERLFHDHKIGKTYHAVVAGHPPKEGRLVDYAQKDAEGAFVRIVPKDTPGALRMALSYRTLVYGNDTALIEIDLETGRTHQIRVQTAHAGFPVLGDDKYGDRPLNKKYRVRRQQLLCKRLVLPKEAGGHVFESQKELTLPREKNDGRNER